MEKIGLKFLEIKNMRSEDFVTFSIMRHLQNHKWHILQYHPPGGQACFALSLDDNIVYPDIVAYRDSIILILENKSRFSANDIQKLEAMQKSKKCKNGLDFFITEYLDLKNLFRPISYSYVWGHGYSGEMQTIAHSNVALIHVCDNGDITIVNSNIINL